MKPWLVIVALAACACPGKQATGVNGGSQAGNGSQAGSQGSGVATPVDPITNARTCDDLKPRVEKLYRAEAVEREPKRVEAAVADNTAMVMADCAKDPARVVPCVASAPTVADLERRCLAPLDDEGTDGEALK